jgi:curved DNA-binding protein CbpA
MLNYYQVLGVSQDASDKIIKIAYEGKLKALGKAGLSEEETRNEQRLLEQAYVTLSNPAKRSWHDKQLDLEQHAATDAARARNRMGWFAAAILAVLLVGGSSYYAVQRIDQRERNRLEELRIVNARAKEEARVAAEEERMVQENAALQYSRESDASRQYARDRAYMDRQGRYNRDSAYQDQVRSRALNTWDRRESNYEDDRSRYLSEADRRNAWQEVERQKRFVAEREREEERIRAERHYRVQQETEATRAREIAETESGLVPSRKPLRRPYP